jgi:hypothetical protein
MVYWYWYTGVLVVFGRKKPFPCFFDDFPKILGAVLSSSELRRNIF